MFPWFSAKDAPLKPLPLSQRLKSYSAATGIVYQYIFLGLWGRRHVFEVSADRQPAFNLFIELRPKELASCAERMGSPLRWNEEYALSKLSLFAAMDAAETAAVLRQVIHPTSEELMLYMTELNMG